MTNFNPNNNFNYNQNLFNLLNSTINKQLQTNFDTQAGNNIHAILNTAGQNIIQNEILVNNFFVNANLFQMDTETELQYLQNLLNLPNSLDKLFYELNTNKKINPKAINVLIDNFINLKALDQLLNEKSKDAIQKLLNSIAQISKTTGKDLTQMKELLGILNSIHANTLDNSTMTNSLKELLLLYIPINFEAFRQDVDFKKLNDEEKEKISSSKLNILIQTINLSNILCIINCIDDAIYIDLRASEDFSYERFEKIVLSLAKEALIKTYIEFTPNKKSDKKGTIQNFKVISQGNIPINILLICHIVIKTIFNIDSSF